MYLGASACKEKMLVALRATRECGTRDLVGLLSVAICLGLDMEYVQYKHMFVSDTTVC